MLSRASEPSGASRPGARLIRYGISGTASAATHFGTGLALIAGPHVPAVPASTAGFVASVLVSYALQRTWVFRSTATHAVAGGKFLAVTACAVALNTLVLWLGTVVLHGTYPVAQAVALVAIPVLNYSVNSRWTFRTGNA